MRSFITVVLLCVLGTASNGQDRGDWQSLAQLQPGDKIRLSMKTGPVEGAFRNWTPQEVTAGTVTARREDVVKIERYRKGGWGRARNAALGAAIGFGGGAAIGAALGGCRQGQLCLVGRGTVAAAVGGVGLVVGAGVGALIPRHNKDLIYSAK